MLKVDPVFELEWHFIAFFLQASKRRIDDGANQAFRRSVLGINNDTNLFTVSVEICLFFQAKENPVEGLILLVIIKSKV